MKNFSDVHIKIKLILPPAAASMDTATHHHQPQHFTHTNTHHLPPTDQSDGDDDHNDGLNLVGTREEQSASQAGRTEDARGGVLEGRRVTAEGDRPRACSCCTHTAPGHGHGT